MIYPELTLIINNPGSGKISGILEGVEKLRSTPTCGGIFAKIAKSSPHM
jgi:hypothetical protein